MTSMLNDVNDKLGSGTDVMDGLSGAKPREPPPLPEVTPEFKNGENIDAPPDGAIPLPAVADGQTPAPNTTPMEFLHFGTAYKAVSRRFAHAELDDTMPVDLEGILGGRGIMFRAALQREALLLGGFIDATRQALVEDEAQKGALGELMDRVGDLIGGAGGSSGTTKPEDLNPFFDKLSAAVGPILAAKIEYPALHKAAIDLHQIRSDYRQFLTDQVQSKRDESKKPEAPGGGGLLGGLPGLESLLPPELGKYFKLIKDMAFKAHEVHLILMQEIALRMEPKIEEACRDMTIAAVRTRLSPIFPVWFKAPPPQDNVIDAPSGPGDTGLSPIDDAVGGAFGAMNDAANAVNKVANPIRDFLTLPEEYAPGRPFLDQAFQFTGRAVATATGVTGDASNKADLLGETAASAMQVAFGFEMPEFIVTIVTGICQALSGFLRAAYSRLISLDPTQPLSEADFLEAGRVNLVASLIDVALRSFDVLDFIRKLSINMQSVPGIERIISAEAVLDNAIRMLGEQIGPPMAPVTDDAMKEVYALLEGARSAHPSPTMEMYLAVLPAAYARLFRAVFFPMWNLLVDAVIGPAQSAIGGAMGDMDSAVMGVRNDITDIRNDLDKASKIIDYYSKNGLKVGLLGGDDNTGMLGQILDSPDAYGQATPQTPVLAAAVVLTGRVPNGSADPLTDAILARVEPDLKWKDPEPDEGGASSGGATTPAGGG